MTDKLRELAERWAVRMDRNAKYATALMPDDSAELAEIIRACISILNAEGDGGVAGDNVQCSHCSAIFTRRDWTVDNFDRPIPRCQFCGSSGAPQPVRTTETHPARSGVVSDEDVCAAVDAYNEEMGGIDCDLPKDIRDADHECMRAALSAQIGADGGVGIGCVRHGTTQVVVTKNEAGQIVSVTRQDEEGRIIEVIAESARVARVDVIGMLDPLVRELETMTAPDMVLKQITLLGKFADASCELISEAMQAPTAEPVVPDGWRIEKAQQNRLLVCGNGRCVEVDFGDELYPFFAQLAASPQPGDPG